MAKRQGNRRPRKPGDSPRGGGRPAPSSGGSRPAAGKPPADKSASRSAPAGKPVLKVKKLGDSWELVHPACAQDRRDDIEEVEQMLVMGEFEIAQDELRWLLTDCSEFVSAHKLLGEIAMGNEDAKLARAHFGYAYHIGDQALKAAGCLGPLPYERAANRDFLEAAKGLAWSLEQQGKAGEAIAIAKRLLSLDETDPLNVRGWLAELTVR